MNWRTERMEVRATPEQKEMIVECADRLGLSVSDLLLRAAMPYAEAFNPIFLTQAPVEISRNKPKKKA